MFNYSGEPIRLEGDDVSFVLGSETISGYDVAIGDASPQEVTFE